MKKKRPVLQDVADCVGVTKMTVSRYLRDPNQVSATLREKIAAAVEDLGYIPNRAPDILSNATSRCIGILLPSLTNQVFAEVLRGVESVTDIHGYQTMLAHYGYSPEREEERLTSLLSWNIDGLILAERQHTPRTLKMIAVAGIPVVEVMDSVSPCIDMAVGFNNVDAARQMTRFIIAKGHTHVVYHGARLDERTRMKQEGYAQAMEEAGLVPVSTLTERASSYSVGAELLQQTLREHPNTNGIFCTNDDLAIGAFFECQRRGLRVPEDIAIAGFHGLDPGQAMEPQLASVVTPRHAMGRVAAELLLTRLKGDSVTAPCIDLGFTLLPGAST